MISTDTSSTRDPSFRESTRRSDYDGACVRGGGSAGDDQDLE